MEAANWFPEHELDADSDYGFMQHYRQVSSCLPDFPSQDMEVATHIDMDELHKSFSLESYSSNPTTFYSDKRPNKHQKTDHNNCQSSKTSSSSSPPPPPPSQILSFGTPGGDTDLQVYGKPEEEAAISPTSSTIQFQTGMVVCCDVRTSLEKPDQYPDAKADIAYQKNKRPHSSLTKGNSMEDHVMAERKRREKLNQRLIALSAVIPGLKKMDKATILTEAIKHVKELQDRIHILEEQNKKRTMESVVLVKKSQVIVSTTSTSSEDSCLSDEVSETNEPSTGSVLQEVEVRISDKDVLIRIHCEKGQGILSNILNEIERLHLTVTNSSVVPFGNSNLDITVISQMEQEFSKSIKDFVKHLTQAFSKFM